VVKRERRARQIRITEKTYNELAKLGDVTDDFEDVVARLLKYYKDREQRK
jgi:predicted CopG family antitoxin